MLRYLVSTSLVFTCLSFFAPHSLSASEPLTEHIRKLGNSKPQPATIEDMKWLAGTWRGKGMGGTVEEIWSEPQAGVMMGMFRFMQEGKLQMLELMTLSEKDDKGCYFEGITFAPDQNRLAIYVAMKGKEGKMDEIRFDFERVTTPGK